MNRQEIVNQSFLGLWKQNCKSLSNENDYMCAYRGRNEAKCGIGHLIPDEVYAAYGEIIENKTIYAILQCGYFPAINNLFDKDDLTFLHDLQRIHDRINTGSFRTRLKELYQSFCNTHGLIMPEIPAEINT